MRKRVIGREREAASVTDAKSLNLEALAQVEVTSEDPAHPIESALLADEGPGWRAAEPGPQTVRLVFDRPQRISRIHLEFDEEEAERTQQFVLRWSPDGGQSYKEIVRQQYNFSRPGSTRERENYDVKLDGVTALELNIVPDISGGSAPASLHRLRVG